jgi:anti-sigma B factor antagonist
MSLSISIGTADNLAVVAVSGELDLATASELLAAVGDLIDTGHDRVVLDLGDLTFCDSAGLSVIARLTKRIGAVQGALILARPARIVRAVLEVTGMTELLPVFATVEEAQAAARG